MSGGEAVGGKEAAALVPADWGKLAKDLAKIVSRPEAEIYATLSECGMDPDEAVSRLLSEDGFKEVKKRGKKKEIEDAPESRRQTKNFSSNDNLGPRPPVSGPGMRPANSRHKQTIANSSLQSSSGFRHGDWSHRRRQLLLSDFVKMGRSHEKTFNKPVVTGDRAYSGQYPSLPSTNQNLKPPGNMVLPTEVYNSTHSSSTGNITSRPAVLGSGMTSVDLILRQTIASTSSEKHMVTDGRAVSLQSMSSELEHGGCSGTDIHFDENNTFAMRPAPASERQLEPIDDIFEYNDGILKNSSSYEPHTFSYVEQATNEKIQRSSSKRSRQQEILHKGNVAVLY